jgi:hypothetical protein
MPVDSNQFLIIFCEGKPSSLDYLLLNHILPIGQVRIRPVGGKFGIRAYVQGYLATYQQSTPPPYIVFRDRDFDIEPPDTPQLIEQKTGSSVWMSYRASIENYLIDADLLHQYWAERQNTPKWAHGSAPAIEVIENHIDESARELIDYQAIRWGLAHLKPDSHWPFVRTTWTKHGSGDLPSSLDYDNCLTEACQLVQSFQDQIKNVQSDLLKKYVKDYRKRFTNQNFLKNREYLIWFHGKDHLAQLCRHLAPNFPRRHYADWAAEHLNINKYPDLQQLVNLAEGAET